MMGHKEMTFEASSYILFIIRPWGERVMDKFRLPVIPRYVWRCIKGVWSGAGVQMNNYKNHASAPGTESVERGTRERASRVLRAPVGFSTELSLSSLENAKHYPFVSLSSMYSFPPKHLSFSDQKKCPTCSILLVGNLLNLNWTRQGRFSVFSLEPLLETQKPQKWETKNLQQGLSTGV